jgi:hypothetical protein
MFFVFSETWRFLLRVSLLGSEDPTNPSPPPKQCSLSGFSRGAVQTSGLFETVLQFDIKIHQFNAGCDAKLSSRANMLWDVSELKPGFWAMKNPFFAEERCERRAFCVWYNALPGSCRSGLCSNIARARLDRNTDRHGVHEVFRLSFLRVLVFTQERSFPQGAS